MADGPDTKMFLKGPTERKVADMAGSEINVMHPVNHMLECAFNNHIKMKDTRIWKPKIGIKTQKDKDSIIMEKDLKLKKEGKAEMSCGMECLSPNETYKGSENLLILSNTLAFVDPECYN